MRTRLITLIFMNVFIICHAQISDSTEVTKRGLYDFTIDDLLNLKVTTASKSKENIEDAAAILSIVTEKEIESYGANNILEVLERVCSIYTLGSALIPENMVSIRGDASVHYNNRVLLLLNGRPVRESITGGIKMAFNTMFPVKRIARIEIIRGPGSVLYGTGAYTGVINVITKTSEAPSISGQVLGGSFGRLQANVEGSTTYKSLNIAGGINVVNDQGWNFTAKDSSGTSRSFNRMSKGLGANISAKFKGFSLNTFYCFNDQRAMYFPKQWNTTSIIRGTDTLTNQPFNYIAENQYFFADLGYEKVINKWWRATFNLTSNNNYFNEKAEKGIDDIARSTSNDLLLEMTHFFKASPKINFIAGGLVNRLTGNQVYPISTKVPPTSENPLGLGGFGSYNLYNYNNGKNTDPYPIIPSYMEYWYTGYFQADYSPNTYLKVVAGAQLNAVPNIKIDVVPRVALLIKPNEEITFKLLYGQAFRSASANERFVKVNFVYGNPTLLPEKIETYEAAMFVKNKDNKLNFNMVYFNSIQRNMISRALVKLPDGISQTQYVNIGVRHSQGIEIEANYKFSTGFTLQGSATVVASIDQFKTGNNAGNDTTYYRQNFQSMPAGMAKFALIYDWKKGMSLSLFNNFYGGSNVYASGSNNSLAKTINPEINAVNLLSAQVVVKLNDLTDKRLFNGLSLGTYCTNLLDENVMVSDPQQGINTLPSRGGRAVYLFLKYQI